MVSFWSRWFRNLKTSTSLARQQCHRPRLEFLEDRLTPATFSVNSTLDTVAVNLATGQDAASNITLRSAIQAANSAAITNPGNITIILPAGEYTLTRAGTGEDAAAAGDLDIKNNTGKVTIIGAGANVTLIDAAGLDRVFDVLQFANLELFGVTVLNGSSDFGGGIYNAGTAAITNCFLSGNTAGQNGGAIFNSNWMTITETSLVGNSASNQGGGIFNLAEGNLTIIGSTLSGNSADNQGGGIFNDSVVTITGSTLSGNSADNQGGGIFNGNTSTIATLAAATLTSSTFSANSAQHGGGIYNARIMTVSASNFFGNSATGDGGGIANDLGGAMTVSESYLSSNSATNGGGIMNTYPQSVLTVRGSDLFGNSATDSGGGIYSDSDLTISRTTLSNNSAGNRGGGVRNLGTATVEFSAFIGNSAFTYGGGVYTTDNQMTVSGSTFSGNSSNGFGGGIANFGPMTVTGSTLSGNSADNQGGGVFNGGTLTAANTIIAGNTAGSGQDVQGNVTSSGNNLVGSTAGSLGFGAAGDLLNVDPRLGPLTNNGGPTLTHPLLAGSPALDAGSNIGAPPVDQRGFARVVDGPDAGTTATADIGAFEAQIWVGDIADQVIDEGNALVLNLGTSLGITNVFATSGNPAVIPNQNINVTGGAIRTLNISTTLSGTALITVTVSDGRANMTDTFVLTVNAVNHAPTLDNSGLMTLQSINEDDFSSFGTRVADVILSAGGDRIIDPDAGAVEGIAVTSVDNTNGNWQFSTDSAASWISFGSPSVAQARLLAGGAFVRFVPNANFHGAVAGLTFRAWDQTSGANGGTADTTINNTAFSSASETAAITVLAVNDAPVNTVPPAQKTAVNKVLTFSGSRRISIADADAGGSIVRVTLTVTNGTLTLGRTAGLASVVGNGKNKIRLTGTIAQINNALNNLRYRPSTGFRGKANLKIVTEDLGNSGLGGPKLDTDWVSIAVT